VRNIKYSRAEAKASTALHGIHRGYALASFECGKDLLGLGVHEEVEKFYEY
jgi:hypothetical protein